MNRSSNGFAVVVIYIALGIAGGGALVPNWRPWNWPIFHKKAPTGELTAAEKDLQKAKAAAAAAELQLAQAQAARQKAQLDALHNAQEMAAGAALPLARTAPTPEVQLAQQLLGRANIALAVAIGDLPADRQKEIEQIVDQALSAKQQEVDQARALLAQREQDLSAAKGQLQATAVQIPQLEAKAKTADATAAAAQQVVQAKTQEVVTYADGLAKKEQEAGSLTAQIHSLLRIAVLVGLVYLAVHFVLPSLAQEFPAVKALTVADQITKSVTSAHQ